MTESRTTTSSALAWVVFSDQTPVWWARLLKQGFRHCFLIQRDHRGWRILDPYTQPPKSMVLPFPASFDLPQWLRGQGLTVLAAEALPLEQTQPMRWGSLRVLARALGLTAYPIFTPWQLYRRLLPSHFPSNPRRCEQ